MLADVIPPGSRGETVHESHATQVQQNGGNNGGLYNNLLLWSLEWWNLVSVPWLLMMTRMPWCLICLERERRDSVSPALAERY